MNQSFSTEKFDPQEIIDLQKAAERIIQAIKSQQKIVVMGDYDVDGISSTAIFLNFLKMLKISAEYVIPSRTSGYGLSIESIKKYPEHLIIAVDCGSSALQELSYAVENKIDIVVIDHHHMDSIPTACAIVNPHRPDEKDDYKMLCAAGLAFLCCVTINQLLKKSNFYAENQISEPNMMNFLDIVALATVADVVPLRGLNRVFVIEGLKLIRKRQNIGIDALVALYKSGKITSESIGYFFGPRLNAAGRLETADQGLKLLTTQNPIEAKKIADHLEVLNKERQRLEHKMFEEACQSADFSQNFICVAKENWHLGVIGIAAGRLREKFNRPSIVISIDPAGGICKASCRSTDQVDISVLIKKAIEKNIIACGGGHALAAGFSIEKEKIPELEKFLRDEISQEPLAFESYADCIVDLSDLNLHFMSTIAKLQPFGMGNRPPKFVIHNIRIASHKIVGEKHISLMLEDTTSNKKQKAISFRSVDTPLGEILMTRQDPILALGSLSVSEWNGNMYVDFQLDDVAES